jgi:hypothetical protein
LHYSTAIGFIHGWVCTWQAGTKQHHLFYSKKDFFKKHKKIIFSSCLMHNVGMTLLTGPFAFDVSKKFKKKAPLIHAPGLQS